jgi:hypothetical protein
MKNVKIITKLKHTVKHTYPTQFANNCSYKCTLCEGIQYIWIFGLNLLYMFMTNDVFHNKIKVCVGYVCLTVCLSFVIIFTFFIYIIYVC